MSVLATDLGSAFSPAVRLVARLWRAAPLARWVEELRFNLTGWPAVDNGLMAADAVVTAAARRAGNALEVLLCA
jgi:hypothetical protein